MNRRLVFFLKGQDLGATPVRAHVCYLYSHPGLKKGHRSSQTAETASFTSVTADWEGLQTPRSCSENPREHVCLLPSSTLYSGQNHSPFTIKDGRRKREHHIWSSWKKYIADILTFQLVPRIPVGNAFRKGLSVVTPSPFVHAGMVERISFCQMNKDIIIKRPAIAFQRAGNCRMKIAIM